MVFADESAKARLTPGGKGSSLNAGQRSQDENVLPNRFPLERENTR
jgi:hypothetical protein